MIHSASAGFPQLPSIRIPPVDQPSKSGPQDGSAQDPIARMMRIPNVGDVSQATLEDWDCMLRAVAERLINSLAMPADRSLPSLAIAAQRLKEVVMECTGDLDRLHAALSSEDAKHRKLEADAIASSTAVLQTICASGAPPRRT